MGMFVFFEIDYDLIEDFEEDLASFINDKEKRRHNPALKELIYFSCSAANVSNIKFWSISNGV